MSVVNILNIQVLDNPSRFTNPFQFEITFECTSPLKTDLEWKIIYVGSAEDERYDQILDCIMVGPVPVGINKFVFQADAPDTRRIPPADIIGVTVALLTCSYQGQEFVRVGYYVNNEYDEETLALMNAAANTESTPNEIDDNSSSSSNTTTTADKSSIVPQVEHLIRNILADKPRVTRFPIKWDAVDELEPPPPQPELPAELTTNPGSWDDDDNDSRGNEEEDDNNEMEGGDDMAVTSEMDEDEAIEESDDDDGDDDDDDDDDGGGDGLIHSTPEHQNINPTNIFSTDAKLRDPFVDPLKKTTMNEERQMSVD